MPYVCGKCYKTKSGAGGRKHRSHGPAKKRRSAYQACLSREMKKIKTKDPSMKMRMVQNACGRLRKKGKK